MHQTLFQSFWWPAFWKSQYLHFLASLSSLILFFQLWYHFNITCLPVYNACTLHQFCGGFGLDLLYFLLCSFLLVTRVCPTARKYVLATTRDSMAAEALYCLLNEDSEEDSLTKCSWPATSSRSESVSSGCSILVISVGCSKWRVSSAFHSCILHVFSPCNIERNLSCILPFTVLS